MNQAELDFYNMFSDIRVANREEDMFGHFDFVIDKCIKVDVKGAKRINRNDLYTNHSIHYIEFINVRGAKGWISGEADYIAFEYYNYFVFVTRQAILDLCKEKVIDKSIYNTKELYKLYSRNGRLDVMTLVPTIDLIKISSFSLTKNKINMIPKKVEFNEGSNEQEAFLKCKQMYAMFQELVSENIDCTIQDDVVNHLSAMAGALGDAVMCKARLDNLTDKLSMKAMMNIKDVECSPNERKVLLAFSIGDCSFYNNVMGLLITEAHYKIDILRNCLSYRKTELSLK